MVDKKKSWKVLEWFMPINETATIGNDFIIKGVAVSETTSRNNVKYIARELEAAAPSWKGKPMLTDHKNEVRAIVGRVINSTWNPTNKNVEFEAKIMDKEIQKMINDGRIQDVSIGAKVDDLVESKDSDVVTAVGIEGLELSFCAVPGIEAQGINSIGAAMANSLVLREKMEANSVEELESDTIEVVSNAVNNMLKYDKSEKDSNILNKAKELLENPKAKLNIKLK